MISQHWWNPLQKGWLEVLSPHCCSKQDYSPHWMGTAGALSHCVWAPSRGSGFTSSPDSLSQSALACSWDLPVTTCCGQYASWYEMEVNEQGELEQSTTFSSRRCTPRCSRRSKGQRKQSSKSLLPAHLTCDVTAVIHCSLHVFLGLITAFTLPLCKSCPAPLSGWLEVQPWCLWHLHTCQAAAFDIQSGSQGQVGFKMLQIINIMGTGKLKLPLRERRKELKLSHLGKHLLCAPAASEGEQPGKRALPGVVQHWLGPPALPAPTGGKSINITASPPDGESDRTSTLAWGAGPFSKLATLVSSPAHQHKLHHPHLTSIRWAMNLASVQLCPGRQQPCHLCLSIRDFQITLQHLP